MGNRHVGVRYCGLMQWRVASSLLELPTGCSDPTAVNNITADMEKWTPSECWRTLLFSICFPANIDRC
jgi:hypothetical protein